MSTTKELKKQYPYNTLSPDHRCAVCQRNIKKRLVHQKKTPPKLCYKDWMQKRAPKPQVNRI